MHFNLVAGNRGFNALELVKLKEEVKKEETKKEPKEQLPQKPTLQLHGKQSTSGRSGRFIVHVAFWNCSGRSCDVLNLLAMH